MGVKSKKLKNMCRVVPDSIYKNQEKYRRNTRKSHEAYSCGDFIWREYMEKYEKGKLNTLSR